MCSCSSIAFFFTLASADYVDSTVELSLDGSTPRACTNFTILDDQVLEDVETFSVMLTEDDPRVQVAAGRDEATIEIADNDGKQESSEIEQQIFLSDYRTKRKVLTSLCDSASSFFPMQRWS